jgi:putative ABC transport system permease protein
MNDLLFDLRDSIRGFRRDRLHAAAVVGTLALTLGASTAVFSIVNGVLLRPLPYPEPRRLVSIREVLPKLAQQYPSLPANARHVEEWRTRSTSFEAIAALDWRTTTLTGAGEPAQVAVLRASGTLFDVLQAPVALGRALTRDDERFDRPAVAVISEGIWRDRLGRDPAVLGRALTLGGTQYTIVGILPAGYELPRFDALSAAGSLRSTVDAITPLRLRLDTIGWMGTFNYPVVGRLKPGASLDQAAAELNLLQRSIGQIARSQGLEGEDLTASVVPLGEAIVGRARLGLLLLLGAIGCVVLIACSNLANLALTRTLGRMRDTAVRSALGAGNGRLVRQVVVEQLVLAVAGGALGLTIARQALNLFVGTAPIDLPRAADVADVAIDGRVLAFAALATIAAGLSVALLPAWRVSRQDVQDVLRAGDRGASDRGGLRARASLLAMQVALSVVLLVVTGLFITSLGRLVRIDPGFSTDRVVAVEIAPIGARYPDTAARAALYDRILERVKQLSSIRTASFTSVLPLTGETWVDLVTRLDDGRTPAEKPNANYRFVGPDYFRTMSLPVLHGRGFEPRDRTKAITPAVISARTAATLWPGQDALGREFDRGDAGRRFEVVGVVADGRLTSLETGSPLMVYVPYWVINEGKSVLVARTEAAAASAIGELRAAVRAVDPEIAIAEAAPLQLVVDRALEGRRYQVGLFTGFGLVALAIAAIGIYATTAYGVSRRRREMNIRVALGARVGQVFGLVLVQAMTPVLIGIVAGAAGALALGTVVARLLFEVRASDPLVIASVIALVGGTALIAATAAARQGLRLNPAAALREE